MAIKYFKLTKSISRNILPINPLPSRIHTMRIINNVVYGYDDKPYNFVNMSTSSYSYTWYFAQLNSTSDKTTRTTIGYSGEVDLDTQPSLFFGVDDTSQFYSVANRYWNSVNEENFSGVYKVNINKIKTLNVSVPSWSAYYGIPVFIRFTIENDNFIGMYITSNRYASSSDLIYKGDIIYLIKQDGTPIRYTILEFAETYNNKKINFLGTTSLPVEIVNWFTEIFDVVYPNNLYIYNTDGSELLTSLEEIPPIIKTELSVLGDYKYLLITYFNNTQTNIEWNSTTPDGKVFTGLSTKPNSNVVSIPINKEISINLSNDVKLYETYGIYRPPTTTFNLELYKNSAEIDRVDKTNYLEQVGTISGALRDETSITDLALTIEYPQFPQFNYVYIPIFNRYYFVTDITSIRYNIWEISLSIDVLMSYKDAILMQKAFVERNEFTFDEDIIDNKRVVIQGYDVTEHTVPNDLFGTDYSYILTAFGCKSYKEG